MTREEAFKILQLVPEKASPEDIIRVYGRMIICRFIGDNSIRMIL